MSSRVAREIEMSTAISTQKTRPIHKINRDGERRAVAKAKIDAAVREADRDTLHATRKAADGEPLHVRLSTRPRLKSRVVKSFK